jgi:hypothetical protein
MAREIIHPNLDQDDLKHFNRNLFMMGLTERDPGKGIKLTRLGGVVYARLIAQSGS